MSTTIAPPPALDFVAIRETLVKGVELAKTLQEYNAAPEKRRTQIVDVGGAIVSPIPWRLWAKI